MRAMVRSILLAAATSAALLTACIPAPQGRCASDSDCGYGLGCQDALCQPKPCDPTCAAGLHCNGGACALDSAPVISWSSPADGAAASSGQVQLALRIATPATDVIASIVISPAGTGLPRGPQVVVPMALGADGLYRGLADASLLAEQSWQLTPVISAAGAEFGGPARRILIDRTGPTISLAIPSPASGAFLRSDTIHLTATINDRGAGLGSTPPAISAPGMSALSGTGSASGAWSFALALSAPTFSAATGPLAFTITAKDLLGNATTQRFSLPVTRTAWTHSFGAGLPIRSSPALDAHHLFIGTDRGDVLAIDRTTSATLWSRTLSGPISASPALGAHALYVASESGQVRAIDPSTGNVLWTCSDLPAGMSFLSSPAIALINAGANGARLEAIALTNTGSTMVGTQTISGGLFLLEGSTGFLRADGQRTCFLSAPVSGGRSSPAIDNFGAIYAGGDDGKAHSLSIAQDAAGRFSLHENWSFSTSDDVTASPAPGAAGIAFGAESGSLFFVNPDGSTRVRTGGLADKLFASPVFAGDTLLALDRSGALSPFNLLTLPAASSPGPYLASQIPGVSNVQSTPAIGSDGTVYVAAGRALYALAPSGTVLWSAPLVGTATTSSPTIGCDGTLYLGDSSGTVSAFLTDSRGLADGWARFHHDARNTGNVALGSCE
jgi:outer membrane protein assembly factor BamB